FDSARLRLAARAAPPRLLAELGRIDAGAPDHVVEVLAVLLGEPRGPADVAVAAPQEARHITPLERALRVLERGDLVRRRGDQHRLGRGRAAAAEPKGLADSLGGLARVAGPRVGEERRARSPREADRLDLGLRRGEAKEVRSEREDVLGPFRERRDDDLVVREVAQDRARGGGGGHPDPPRRERDGTSVTPPPEGAIGERAR